MLSLRICISLSLTLLVFFLFSCPMKAAETNIPQSVKTITKAVVRIHVVEAEYAEGRETKSEAFGSGVIINPEGFVLTNHHVAGDGKYFFCTMADKSELKATLVGTDPVTDLAVLKLSSAKIPYPVARFGNSARVKVGDRVFAIGSPLALSQSITTGIVSNAKMSLPDVFSEGLFLIDGEDIGAVVQWIGHDAAIYGGNSGGPLLNTRGEIIGINEISLGLSGAIPANLAREISQQLMKNGAVKRGWLGVSVQPLLQSSANIQGALVLDTINGSPARQAGLLSGDILIRLNGKAVDVRLKEDLPRFNLQVMDLPIGVPVSAVVLRSGKEVTLTATPQIRPVAKPRTVVSPEWGLCISELTRLAAYSLERNTVAGVHVVSVRPGGPAGTTKPALTDDDIIVQLNNTPVNTPEEFIKITANLLKDKNEPVTVLVAFDRQLERLRTVVTLNVAKSEDSGYEVRKAWLPITSQVLTRDLAKAMGLEGKHGVCITRVYAHTSAEKAGLQVGDIILSLDGMPIPAEDVQDVDVLPTLVRQYAVDSNVELAIIRDGKEMTIPIQLTVAPPSVREMQEYTNDRFEFTARDIAVIDRMNHDWDEKVSGAIVTSVTPGGWAALGKLSMDDLIVAVNSEVVTDAASLATALQHVAAEKPAIVVVQVKQKQRTHFLEWRADWM